MRLAKHASPKSYPIDVNHVCPSCGTVLPEKVREAFCPVCTLQGVLQGEAPPGARAAIRFIERVGDYELIEEIARGGVGAVYKARQISLGRTVALKLLLAGHFADPKARQRFRAEAESAARLRHPNIVTIHEVGEHEGQPFLAMEFIEGGTLADRVRDQPLSALQAATCVAKVARAISNAHARGIVHRDLKPSNILLDRFDEPRVTDFGLAKQLGADTELTLTGQVLGSPAYMSPEQSAGRQDTIGPATDIYALGAILYQSVTGRPPFQGDSAAAVIRQVQEAEPVSVRGLNPGVPLDLETLILRCLEKDPAQRYRTAQELADELERFTRGEPIRARPLSPVERTWRWCKRHPVRASSLAVIIGLLVVIATGSTIAAMRIRRAERAATSSLRQALLSEANAVRLGGRVGQRVRSLEALRTLPLDGASEEERFRARNEVLAALALDDIQFVPQRQLPAVEDASSAAFSGDQALYGFMRKDGGFSVVRTSDGVELKRLDLRAAPLPRVAGFGFQNRFVELYSARETAIWDLETGRECFRTNVSSLCIDLHPAQPAFVLGERDGTIRFLELPSGAEIKRWPPAGEGEAQAEPKTKPGFGGSLALPTQTSRQASPAWKVIQFSPDGTRLVAASGVSNKLVAFEVESGRQLARWEHTEPILRSEWAQGGRYLATAAADGRVAVWDAVLKTRSWFFGEGTPGVRDLAWSPDGHRLAVTCIDHNVWVWDTSAARLAFIIPCNADEIIFSADGRRVGPVWRDGVTGWLEAVRSEEFHEWVAGATAFTNQSVEFTSDNRLVLVRSTDALMVFLSTNYLVYAELWRGLMHDARFDADGEHVWILHPGGVSRRAVRLATHSPAIEKGMREDFLRGRDWRAMAITKTSGQIVLGRADQSIWRLIAGEMDPQLILGATNRVRFAAFSPDGRWLATLGADQRLKVRDIVSGETQFERETPGAARVAFSPDGRWLATFATRVEVVDVGTWSRAPKLVLPPNRPSGRALSFAADSRSVFVTSDLAEIQQFDLLTGRAIAVFQAPSRNRVNGLDISSDGRYLAAACNNGRVQAWDLQRLRQVLAKFGLD